MRSETHVDVLPYVKFLFEIDNPSLEECYQHGYQMSLDGALEEDNPFMDRGMKEAGYWNQGWWDACYAIEPAFEFEPVYTDIVTPTEQSVHWSEEKCANEVEFEDTTDSKVTAISQIAAISAALFMCYQVVDMIA